MIPNSLYECWGDGCKRFERIVHINEEMPFLDILFLK